MKASEVVTKENAGIVKQVIEFLAVKPITDPMTVRLYALAIAVSEAEKRAEAEMLDVPTWKRKYLESGGVNCLLCESSDDVGGDSRPRGSHDPGLVRQDVYCLKCGARWRDWFKLADVEMLPREEEHGQEG